jgi:hypothetical protein
MAYAAWMLASGGGMVMAQQAGLDAIGAGLILFATVSAWWWLQRHFSSHLKERGQW